MRSLTPTGGPGLEIWIITGTWTRTERTVR